MIKLIFIIAIVAIVSGCATAPINCNGVMGNTKYLPEDSNSDLYKKIAAEIYLYAQMSSNVYEEEEETFFLPQHVRLVKSVDKGWGFQAHVYEIYVNDTEIKEVVISYRGTEGVTDWIWGNIFSTQYDLADDLYLEVKEEYGNIKIVTTGHSLGGGLALHTSVVEDGVEAYVFNPSYRIHRKGPEKDNRRVVVAETGEILKLHRAIWKNPKNTYYGDFYCTNINNHSMYLLARCTTHVAAIHDEVAELSINKNPTKQCSKR